MTRRVGFLIFPDLQILDAAGPIAAFEIAGRYGQGAYDLRVLAAAPGDVCSSSGAAMTAAPFDPAERLDTLVVAGGDGTRVASNDAALLAAVRQAAGMRGGSPASARAPSSSPPRACLTAAGRPPIGRAPRTSPAGSRRCGWKRTGYMCGTARCGPRPGSPPASISRWR
jgi:hypothetical protein